MKRTEDRVTTSLNDRRGKKNSRTGREIRVSHRLRTRTRIHSSKRRSDAIGGTGCKHESEALPDCQGNAGVLTQVWSRGVLVNEGWTNKKG